MKKTLVALLAVLIALVVAVPASADQPVVAFDGDFENTWDFFDCSWLGPEYGYTFTIMRHDFGHATFTQFYDRDGVNVRSFEKDRGTMEWYSDENPDYRLVSKFDLQLHFDLLTQDPLLWNLRYTGEYYNVNVPGMGTVIHFSGQSEQVVGELVPPMEIKFAGNQTWDFAEFCAALAQ